MTYPDSGSDWDDHYGSPPPDDEMYDAGWNDALIAIESAWRSSDGDFDFAMWKLRHGDGR